MSNIKVTPCKFYDCLKLEEYNSLIKDGIIPDETSLIKKVCNVSNICCSEDKLCFTCNPIKFQNMIIRYLKRKRVKDDPKNILKTIDIDEFTKVCTDNGKCCKIRSTRRYSKIKYDLIYGNYLLDIKCYKKEKFTTSQLRRFICQVSIYYSLLNKTQKKDIKYLGIYNPLYNILYQFPIEKVDSYKLKDIYNKKL